MDHRASHLPERAEIERIQTEQVAAGDRLGALQIALEDLDTQVSRFESEIDGVRQREDRDRSLLQSVADSKQLSELQHELETLQRRQSSLEDSLIEVMEHREQLQNQQAAEAAVIEGLQSDLAAAQHALDTTLADIDHHRRVHSSRRDELAADLAPDLLALYERQRSGGGPGAGADAGRPLWGVPDRDRPRRAGADLRGRRRRSAAVPGVQRNPVAAQGRQPVKVVVEADGGSRGNPGPAGYGSVVWSADRSIVLAESKQAIGRATNNVAEYRGLIAGLEEAAKLQATEVAVSMDSKLVVEQMSGRWKVKHPDLAELHAQARALASRFDRISYTWIPRAENSHADRLANEAMDAAAELPRRAGAVIGDAFGAGMDRRARRRHPSAAAAARPDRIVGPAALFGPRQSAADHWADSRPTRPPATWGLAAESRR